MPRDRLEELRSRVRDARLVALVDSAGEPLTLGGEADGVDVAAVARSMVEQRRAADAEPDPLDGGGLRLFVVETDRNRILLGAVSESLCLMLVVGRSANDGQARFELRRAIHDLQQQS